MINSWAGGAPYDNRMDDINRDNNRDTPIVTDVVIVGAGPCGLFQVFELGLLGLQAHVIDALPRVGGQCIELYPDKPIYDIPAYPVIGAQELVDRLCEQIAPFAPGMHLGHQVETLEPRGERYLVTTHRGLTFDCAAVVIAAGLGAFAPRRLKVPGLAPLEGRSIHYRVTDKRQFDDQDLVILGGGDSALDWTLELVASARSVTLVHRREDFRAQPASVAKMRALCDAYEMSMLVGTVADVIVDDSGAMQALSIRGRDGVTRRLDCDHALVFYGLSPNLGPINDWELELAKKQIVVDTAAFETTRAGIYAIGDVCTYPGKKKLILSGFHEAALAAFAIAERLAGDRKAHLQYTTTSPIMHRRLGVEDVKETTHA